MKHLKSLTASAALIFTTGSFSEAVSPTTLSGTLLEESSGIPVYENVYTLESVENGAHANIQIDVDNFSEQITATIFMYAGPTAFTLSWLNHTVYYEASSWYEESGNQGKSIPVETDSWNQVEWQIDNLARTITVKVDGELLVSKTNQPPAWSTELESGIISLRTDASDGILTWTDAVASTQGHLSVTGENDSPELGGDPNGEFPRIEAIGYSTSSGGSATVSELDKKAYAQSLLEMSRNLDPNAIKRTLKNRKSRDHLSTNQGLFTPLQ